MKKADVDLSIITDPDSQFYLSRFKALTYSRPIVLLIDKEKSMFVVPGLEEIHAKESTYVDELHVYYEHPERQEDGIEYKQKIKELLAHYPKKINIGVDLQVASARFVNYLKKFNLNIIDIGNEIIKMRYVKYPDELALIEEAGRLVSFAVNETFKVCQSDITEIALDYSGNKALLSQMSNMESNYLDLFSMSPSGPDRTVLPHVFSSTRKFKKGDGIIHSRQVNYNGYRSELERTVFIGEPTQQQKAVFEVVLTAQEIAMDFIKPGVSAAEVDHIAREVIRKEGFAEYAVHRTGHGIGVSPHEEPYLRFDNDLVLKEGMVFTIEPGIYIPGLGGFRHSDTVILTENGNNVITEYPRDLESLIFD